ncbi:MAG: thioredoxin family protein [Parcubacteria group bacterium]|nr:thioredoxin family protein [Parcubacteria group bacterium]
MINKNKILGLFLVITLILSFFSFYSSSRAQEKEVNLYFFWGQGCPHCAHEKPFLESLKSKYPQLKIYDFEVWYNQKNRDLLIEVGKKLKIDISGVPLTIINDQPIIGYYDDTTTGKQIEDLIIKCLNSSCKDSVREIVFKNLTTTTKKETPSTTTTTTISQKEIKAYLFWAEGCPLCSAEKTFLNQLKEEYSNLNITYLNVSKNNNNDILKQTVEELNIENPSLPLLIIGEKTIIGWRDQDTSGKAIRDAINCYLENECPDLVGQVLTRFNTFGQFTKDKPLPEKIKIPLIGDIETKNLSLPALAIIIGGLDGFNPCAMWVLIFLITLLLKMQDRKRMWILGSTFIATSSAVYFLFMNAWLNLILCLGFIFWIRLVVGIVALGSGVYNLRDYFTNQEAACKVTDAKQKKTTMDKMKDIVHRRSFLLALIGIILLAASINLIELICSAGFPVIFTQLLALSNLAKWQYYLYMLLYIFVFMLDDLIVFIGAMITLRVTGITNKYSRLSHLIGGILMLLIGLLLIFKPELLMFG